MQKISKLSLVRQNLRLVKKLYPGLSRSNHSSLRDLTKSFHLSVSRGEILCIEDKWYITHAGLIQIALRRHCRGIRSVLQERQCDSHSNRWVFKATVYKGRDFRAFVGYGDADPSNTSPLVRGAEMRVAETRAVNRALRKAYGIGLCSVEELASFSGPSQSFSASSHSNAIALTTAGIRKNRSSFSVSLFLNLRILLPAKSPVASMPPQKPYGV
jgi:hypothetical protein